MQNLTPNSSNVLIRNSSEVFQCSDNNFMLTGRTALFDNNQLLREPGLLPSFRGNPQHPIYNINQYGVEYLITIFGNNFKAFDFCGRL